MKRWIVCLVALAMLSLCIDSASADRRYRARRHHVAHHYGHAVHHGPVVYHAPPVHRVYASHHQHHYVPGGYLSRVYRPPYVYSPYSHGIVHHHGVPAASIYIGRPGFSLHIGF